MKRIRRIGAVVIVGAILLLAGCGEEVHTHTFQNYIVKQPTCVEAGLLEQVCSECGEKVYSDLQALGHSFVNGVCERCGQQETPSEPVDDEQFMTLSDIYAMSQTLGWMYSEDDFFTRLYNISATALSMDENGRLKAAVDGVSAAVEVPRSDIPADSAAMLGTIAQIEIVRGVLTISDTMGRVIKPGAFDMYTTLVQNTNIVGFAVNLQNELFLLHRDNAVTKAGTFSAGQIESDEGLLLYLERGEEYALYGPLDRTVSEVVSAPTHLGKPVTSVWSDAFYGCAALQSAELAEGITSIRDSAFQYCSSLTQVVLPSTLNTIYGLAFYGCSALHHVLYHGTQEEWAHVKINTTLNDPILCADVYFYSEAQPSQAGNYWRYVDGVPKIWEWQWVG